MTTKDFVTYVAIVAVLMAVLSLIEIGLPLHRRNATRGRVPTNLGLTALTFGLNWFLTTTTTVMALSFPGGIMAKLPLVVQMVLGVVVLDFFTYVAHASLHKVPLLWRLHRLHHSDPFVDVTTTLRTHPLESLWRYLWTYVPALLLGFAAPAIVVYRVVSVLNGLLEHANVAVPSAFDRALTWFWVTPNMHKVHHSTDPKETDTNYGNILSLYDRLFRTFTSSERARSIRYGLA